MIKIEQEITEDLKKLIEKHVYDKNFAFELK